MRKIYRMRIQRIKKVQKWSKVLPPTDNYWLVTISYFGSSRGGRISIYLASPDEEYPTYIEDFTEPRSSTSEIHRLLKWLNREFYGNIPDYLSLDDYDSFEVWMENFEEGIYEIERMICNTFLFNGFVYNKHTTLLSVEPKIDDEHEYIFHYANEVTEKKDRTIKQK